MEPHSQGQLHGRGRLILARLAQWRAHGRAAVWASLFIAALGAKADAADHSIYTNWADMDQATDAKDATGWCAYLRRSGGAPSE